MKVNRVDLNLLVYLDALLRVGGLSEAPVLVRTTDSMTPPAAALELHPMVLEVFTRIF